MNKLLRAVFLTIIIVVFYILWTGALIVSNILIIAATGLIVSLTFVSDEKLPPVSIKKILYSGAYIVHMVKAIILANFDVAARVIQRKIPINPGIIKVKTNLKSNVGKMVLANSITLTPGTLSVDIDGDYLYIHWIDVENLDEDIASKKIVEGFEKYLEVIFG